ncbi:MAG: DUF1592 domain-containing protein [Deltaproteobacteria bacterium]|nr:DUF1592 domain-containing protein [Deltaproteobacteria bacterium]
MLTRAEYDYTVLDLLGDDTRPAQNFAREPLTDGYDNDANANRMSSDGLKRYMEAAETVAARAVRDRRDLLLACDPNAVGCYQQSVARFARRAFRRPLTVEETHAALRVYADGYAAGGANLGLEWAIASILLSPQFLYRDERLAQAPPELTRLSDYQLATRLSYFVWASTPDDALLDAAEAGALATDAGVSAEVERMLKDPRSDRGKLRFLGLWLGVEELETERKDEATYPIWTRSLSRSWQQSLALYLEHVVRDGDNVKTLLTSQTLYANADLSMYTGLAPTADFERFTPTHRTGLLAQPGFLAHFAGPNQSSPVRRGVFVLDKLLCQPPGAPPAGANLIPPAPSTAQTTRERFAAHAQADCAVCHERIDAAGFLFENFDGIGQWRDRENGHAIDAGGELVRARDEKLRGPLHGVEELSERLTKSGQVTDCISREWLRFSLGRTLDVGDLCSLYGVQRAFATSGGSFDALVRAVAKSDAFKAHAAPETMP